MPRTVARRRHLPIAIAGVGLLVACGGGDDPASVVSGGGDEPYELRVGSCDPIRGDGTLTNRSGEPAAFEVTVAYQYTGEDIPVLRTDETPVLADGEAFDFSVGPDPTRGSPSGCRIVGAERIAAADPDVEAVVEREEAAPDGERGSLTVEPAWMVAGINGSIRAVAAHDSVGYMASNLQQGGALFAIELETGALIWEVESDARFELLVPDGSGGVLAASGNLLVAFDGAGNTRWEAVPLRRAEGVAAGSVEQIAIEGDLAIVGGSAPAALAAVDLATGDQRWHLAADEPLATDAIGFSGGADLVAATDHGVLVSGGTPSLRHLALLDIGGTDPTVRWSHPDVGANASTDGTVVVDAVGSTVTAWDVASGAELWSVSDDAWELAPVAGAPAILGDAVIVQRPGSTIALALTSGEQLWEDTTMPAYWSFLGSNVRHGQEVLGQVGTTSYVLMAADGSLTEIAVDADIRGTLGGAAADSGKVLLAAYGSTAAQGSTAFALDLEGMA